MPSKFYRVIVNSKLLAATQMFCVYTVVEISPKPDAKTDEVRDQQMREFERAGTEQYLHSKLHKKSDKVTGDSMLHEYVFAFQ